MKGLIAVLALAIGVTGCYHAIIHTMPPGPPGKTEEMWANSWIAGLIPPPTVDGTEICGAEPVATVETQQTFLNALVGALTSGIYTPVTITVTCAAGSSAQAPDARAPALAEPGQPAPGRTAPPPLLPR